MDPQRLQSSSPPHAFAHIPEDFNNGVEHVVDRSQRSFPAITRAAVLAAFVLPITVLPYLLIRRQLAMLRRKIDEVGATTKILQRDVNQSLSEIVMRKDEYRRVRALLHDMMQEADESRFQVEHLEKKQAASSEAIHSDLRMLLDETQHTRTQAATLRALGTSIADVAAFIHQVELEMGLQSHGKDQHGVERMRLLALRMQNLPQQTKLSGGAESQTDEGDVKEESR